MPLKITVRSVLPSREAGDLMVVGTPLLGKAKNAPSTLDGLERATGGALGRLIKKEEFKGKKDQTISLTTLGKGVKADRVMVVGLGDDSKMSNADARTFAAKAARAANGDKAKRLVLGIPASLGGHLREIAEGLELGAYRFTKYMTGDRRPKAELGQVVICIVGGKEPADAKKSIEVGQIVGAGVNLARDLSNEPPNELYPDTLAAAAKQAGKDSGLTSVTVMSFAEIQKRGMKLLQAVGQGSERKPCMVHMTWKPANPKRRIVLVGKGITFDTGGISIKPAAGMGEMKHDMSGAANVVGFMSIIGQLKPDVEVHGIVAAAENMPDGGSYRPGDVWGSLDGKSVEIVNTDAEGRLILADALAYGRALEPDLMIDNATLTGACVVALGNGTSGWYANNDVAAAEFADAAKASGESMWRMPLVEELKDQLKSDCADIKHTGDRWGGSISAALFLREFIGNVPNWVHCDIAGPAMGDRIRGWDPKGGTGHGVLTFLALIDKASKAAAVPMSAAPKSAPAAAEPKAEAAPKRGPGRPKKAAVAPAPVAKAAPPPAPEKRGPGRPKKSAAPPPAPAPAPVSEKRGPGRPKKVAAAAPAPAPAPEKRGPGRPKKVAAAAPAPAPAAPAKRGPGRPKKVAAAPAPAPQKPLAKTRR
jgi:leucyl aminopeptidase